MLYQVNDWKRVLERWWFSLGECKEIYKFLKIEDPDQEVENFEGHAIEGDTSRLHWDHVWEKASSYRSCWSLF
jgi:hypothetical protein